MSSTTHPQPLPTDAQAQRQLVGTHIEQHVARIVATAPPLTEQQRAKLADLLQRGPAR